MNSAPCLFRRTTDYTHWRAHRVEWLGRRQNYHVLFMGTGSPYGVVQLLILHLYSTPPVTTCVFSPGTLTLWCGVGLDMTVLTITDTSDRSNLSQDVLYGNRGCDSNTADELVQHRNRSVMVGDDVLLQCELSSNLATPVWTLDGSELQGYGLDSGFRVGNDGLLVIESRPEQSGEYTCHALENGVRVAVVTYSVTVRLDMPQHPPPTVDPIQEDSSYYTPWDSDSSTLHPPPPSTAPPSSERPLLPPPPAPLPPTSELLSPRKHGGYCTCPVINILWGLGCLGSHRWFLFYIGFCLQAAAGGSYSLPCCPPAPCRRSSGQSHGTAEKNTGKQQKKRHSISCLT
ncbi:hypothetical protein J4Q44_G00005090 [Coregonus suidteri]|uniref:Ig-like domain-containing protein n=1 Tax=Coregonus suidteri TaxID=861788 RepID=A0AAN8NIQ1_9TELE